MKIAGYILMVFALVSYGMIIRAVFSLVDETRALNSGVWFNRFWWMPALRVHRIAFPASSSRKRIAFRFVLTFVLMLAGMACISLAIVRSVPRLGNSGIPAPVR